MFDNLKKGLYFSKMQLLFNKGLAEGKIVVIATQVVNEGSNMEVYEVGLKVKKDFNLIERCLAYYITYC